MSDQSVLILQHQPDDGPGNLATWLDRHAIPYAIADVAEGPLPAPGRYRALVVLGSSRSAYEIDEPWIQAEHEFVRACADAGTPVLGICFGAQLLALILGGEVQPMAQPELGWCAINGDEPYGGTFFAWHGDRITAPPGSTVLASTAICTHAFAHGRHLGVQYHPELTYDHIDLWISTPRRRQAIIDAGGDIEQIIDATPVLEPGAVAAAGRLYHRFFSQHAGHDAGVTPCPLASPAR